MILQKVFRFSRKKPQLPAIWTKLNDDWNIAPSEGFPDEATLHRLIDATPDMLPLAGSPNITILGSEVQLGTGYADLLGIESSGRPVVIEIKLAKNSEARRAIVAQVLAYAAALHGMTVEQLEKGPLARHLRDSGYADILGAVVAQDQEGVIDRESFDRSLAHHLDSGRFRLVFVLDESPEELVRLIGYLEHIASELQIDLVTVSSLNINGTQAIMRQRVTPERHNSVVEQSRAAGEVSRKASLGAEEFKSKISDAPEPNQKDLHRLADWAKKLEDEGLVKLLSYQGKSRITLLPRIQPDDVTLVTIWNDQNKVYLTAYRKVFERKCPEFIDRVERLNDLAPIKQGSTIHNISDEMLNLLTEAYRAAVLA